MVLLQLEHVYHMACMCHLVHFYRPQYTTRTSGHGRLTEIIELRVDCTQMKGVGVDCIQMAVVMVDCIQSQ